MATISWILFAVLASISAMHFYWAAGGFWPGNDAQTLVNKVVGVKGMKTIPSSLVTAFVAACIFIAGLLPLMWSAQISYPVPQGLVWAGMWLSLAVFLSRGVVGLTPVFSELSPMQPFVDLNRKYYSPLCILIGSGFAGLIYLAGV